MKKDDIKTLVVVISVCLLCVILAIIINYKSNYDKLSPVNDYDAFFSVTSEVNQYVSYISSRKDVSILNVLYEKYIDENNINSENILNYVGDYSNLCSFSADSIDYVDVGKNALYLVKGRIIENDIYETNVIDDDFKVIVLNDTSNNTYAIYPIFDEYKDIINGIRRINIDGNSSNKMISNSKISDVDVCKLYFSNFTSKLIYDIDSAYELLDDSMKEEFSSVSEFKKYIQDNSSSITTFSSLCTSSKLEDERTYTVIDAKENRYYFYEDSVMNYKVKFVFKNKNDD